jgi:hypothetical protein
VRREALKNSRTRECAMRNLARAYLFFLNS